MELVLSKLVSSIVQIIIFAAVPFLWWLFTARKEMTFLKWIGLKGFGGLDKKTLCAWVLGAIVAFAAISFFILSMLSGVEKATSVFSGLGVSALPAALVYAIFNTALPEEVLFRGFLLKRLAAKFGFTAGNIVQSILFGLLHGAMFLSVVGFVKTGLVVLFTASIAWCMGYINEKKANGSIFPSWLIHSSANIVSSLISIFMIV